MQSEVPGHARTSAMRAVAYLNASIKLGLRLPCRRRRFRDVLLVFDESQKNWLILKIHLNAFSAIKTGYIQFDRGCGKGVSEGWVMAKVVKPRGTNLVWSW